MHFLIASIRDKNVLRKIAVLSKSPVFRLFFLLFRRKIKDKQGTNNGRQAPPAVLMFRKEESRYGLICTSNFKRKYFPGHDRK